MKGLVRHSTEKDTDMAKSKYLPSLFTREGQA